MEPCRCVKTNPPMITKPAARWRHEIHCPFVRGIRRWPVDSPHKGQWRGDLIFSLMCASTNDWANSRYAGDLTRHGSHCDVTIMRCWLHDLSTNLCFGLERDICVMLHSSCPSFVMVQSALWLLMVWRLLGAIGRQDICSHNDNVARSTHIRKSQW